MSMTRVGSGVVLLVSLACLLWCPEARAEIKTISCMYNGTVNFSQGVSGNCDLKGAWLDTTNKVTVSGSGVVVGIVSKGGGPLSPYITLRLQIGSNATLGLRTIKLFRPALGGTDFDSFGLNVVAGK